MFFFLVLSKILFFGRFLVGASWNKKLTLGGTSLSILNIIFKITTNFFRNSFLPHFTLKHESAVYAEHRQVQTTPIDTFSVLWDKKFSTKNHDSTKKVSYVQSLSIPETFRNKEGFPYEIFRHSQAKKWWEIVIPQFSIDYGTRKLSETRRWSPPRTFVGDKKLPTSFFMILLSMAYQKFRNRKEGCARMTRNFHKYQKGSFTIFFAAVILWDKKYRKLLVMFFCGSPRSYRQTDEQRRFWHVLSLFFLKIFRPYFIGKENIYLSCSDFSFPIICEGHADFVLQIH